MTWHKREKANHGNLVLHVTLGFNIYTKIQTFHNVYGTSSKYRFTLVKVAKIIYYPFE